LVEDVLTSFSCFLLVYCDPDLVPRCNLSQIVDVV